MLRTWLEPQEVSVPVDYQQAIGGNPLVSQVLFKHGISDRDAARAFLQPKYYQPAPATDLPGLIDAVQLIRAAIAEHKKIGVWGDFDVDGQTATTVLVSALREMGGNVSYHIPIRAEETHGISLPALKKFLEQNVDLIVSCDTGISSHEAIDYANHSRVPVIVTDHHDLPPELPMAAAIVNPKMLVSDHPLSFLSGVGVAYKLIEELLALNGDRESAEQYLDLVALGTVADIATLKKDTRFLLQRGLEVLRQTRRPGLLAMMEMAEVNQSNLTEEHIAFILAPRMNALGRLDDANSMVELLTTADMGQARILALELEGMNAQRKLLSDQVFQAALAQLKTNPALLDQPVLVLSHPSWPAGVIGIVASRLVEQFHRPVILIASPPGELARGSARSIDGVNITSAIAANQSLIKSFGGHPMAAGLSLEAGEIQNFSKAISHTVESMGVLIQKEKDLAIDGYLTLPELSLGLVEDLERLAPFGAGNPSLVLATRNLKHTGYAVVGKANEHLQVTIEDELGHTTRSIWWQGAGYPLPDGLFDLAFSVRASTYRGQHEVQIEWIDYRLVETPAISIEAKYQPIEVVDFRGEIHPLPILNQLIEQGNLVIWGEAGTREKIDCKDRFSLNPDKNLAIWTIPPGLAEIQRVLRAVRPLKVYLFAINPGMDEPEAYLNRLAGLVKFSLNSSSGRASLSALAAATAQRLQVVRAGLAWLEAYGHIKILSIDSDQVQFAAGTKSIVVDAETSSTQLNKALAESAAFRRYYQRADKNRLVAIEPNL